MATHKPPKRDFGTDMTPPSTANGVSGRSPPRAPSHPHAAGDTLGIVTNSDKPAVEPPKYSPRLTGTPLNIAIHVIGSRGDVQPFIALGSALASLHRHRVRLATHGEFKDAVLKSGLEFFDIGGNPAELMAYMVQSPSLIPNVQQIRDGIISQKRAMYVDMLDGFWRSCVQRDQQTETPFVADAIIANPPSFAHVHCAEALGIPLHLMFTMPWTSTKAFPHPLANIRSGGSDPQTMNQLSYSAVEILTWQGLGDIVNRWRVNTLGLEPVPSTEGHRLVEVLEIPFTYCWSPSLVPKPEDWGSHIDVCGFFFREPPSYTPPPDLEDFLKRGPSPIYIGFGSIVVGGIEGLMTTVLSAVRQTGVRAIISRGWSNLAGEDDENIYYIADCPHEWLFQQVSAVIHHGGAGTTACGLKYGRPTLVVPFFGDQPFWGQVIASAGAGPSPIPYRSLTSQRLARGIETCLLPETRAAAQELAESMQLEDGVMAAIESFYRHLPGGGRTACDFHPDQPAALVLGNGAAKVKMCKAVAAVLVDAGKVAADELRPYRSKPISIENLRWDPLTALSSSALSTLKRLVQDTADIVTQTPEVALARPTPDTEGSTGHELRRQRTLPAGAMLPLTGALRVVSDDEVPMVAPGGAPEYKSSSSSRSVSAYASGGLRLAGTATKGVLVDLPLAATEGLRAVPSLYGDTVERHDTIKGFRSGFTVAGKNFYHDMRGGLTDIFVQTYTGKKADGAAGAAKGLGTGVANFIVKTGSAALGLVSYPAQGVYRSIRSATNPVPRAIVAEKLREGEWLVTENPRWKKDRDVIVQDLDGLRAGR